MLSFSINYSHSRGLSYTRCSLLIFYTHDDQSLTHDDTATFHIYTFWSCHFLSLHIKLTHFHHNQPHLCNPQCQLTWYRVSGSDKKALNECWKYNLGCHAYFSSGAARGAEIKRLPEFKHSQLLFNSLTYRMRSFRDNWVFCASSDVVTQLSPLNCPDTQLSPSYAPF